jgi:hypothetical protein
MTVESTINIKHTIITQYQILSKTIYHLEAMLKHLEGQTERSGNRTRTETRRILEAQS